MVARGGRVVRGPIPLQPDAAKALQQLLEVHSTQVEAINAALSAYKPPVKLW